MVSLRSGGRNEGLLEPQDSAPTWSVIQKLQLQAFQRKTLWLQSNQTCNALALPAMVEGKSHADWPSRGLSCETQCFACTGDWGIGGPQQGDQHTKPHPARQTVVLGLNLW